MIKQTVLVIKHWNELTAEELSTMNASHEREWQSGEMDADHHQQNIFFLLKDAEGEILSEAQLVPISGIEFNHKMFAIFGIGGVIANKKGEGYGRQITLAIRDYLVENNKSGVGFTTLDGFYEKCGFKVEKGVVKRFVHQKGDTTVVNTEADRVCYIDGEDHFMEEVLSLSEQNVLLPRDPDW